jgi:hypothetical protein
METFDDQPQPPFPVGAFETPGHVTSPFEDWCELHDIHPEAYGAWEFFEISMRTGAEPPVAHIHLGRGSIVA